MSGDIRDELKRMGIPDELIETAVVDGKPLSELKPRKSRVEGMNKTEAMYSFELIELQREGIISRWAYEPLNFRLAKRTWYKPDFVLWLPNGGVRIVEVKGFLRDDAAAKFKIAREKFPEWEWIMVRRTKSRWERINI